MLFIMSFKESIKNVFNGIQMMILANNLTVVKMAFIIHNANGLVCVECFFRLVFRKERPYLVITLTQKTCFLKMRAFSRKQGKCNTMQLICIKCMHFIAFSGKCNKTPNFQSDLPFTLKNLMGAVWRLSNNIWKRGY